MKQRPLQVLLVEDSLADELITREALNEVLLLDKIHSVEDGVEALAFLRKEGKYASAPRPDLILLDLNLPRLNGREVLAEIKADPDLKSIPVVILSISSADEDILKSYKLNANCYVVKPLDLDELVRVMQAIRHFWFNVVTLPPEK